MDTPSGETTIVTVSLSGQFLQLLGAGPLKDRNPSISYMVTFPTSEEVDTLWGELSEGAEVLMPLDTYDFSARYGWLKDKHGVSWQIMHSGGMDIQTVTPCFLFVGDVFGHAEAAMNDWISIFPDSYVLEDHMIRYGGQTTRSWKGSSITPASSCPDASSSPWTARKIINSRSTRCSR